MNLEPLGLFSLFFIIFISALAQSTVGFGYALFAAPLLLSIGLPLPHVIVLVSSCSFFQSSIGAWKLRDEVPWKITYISSLVRVAFLVIGILLLKELVTFKKEQIRMVIGVVICVIVIVQNGWKPKKTSSMHWGWGGLAFVLSGIMAGVVGMGGPALVLWCLAQDWESKKTRAFLFSAFATSIPVQIVFFNFAFGSEVLKSVGMSIAMIPLILLGSYIGIPLGNRMDKERLKFIAYTILLLLGVGSTVPAFF